MTIRGLESLHNRFAEKLLGDAAAILLVDTPSCFGVPFLQDATAVAANIAGLARVATLLAVPVLLTSREGQGPVRGELAAAIPNCHVFERSGIAVLADRQMLCALQRLRRHVLFLAMWGRSQDVMDVALEAQRAGFDVRVVLDACWFSDDPVGPEVAARMIGAGLELTTWVAVVAALSQEYAADCLPDHIRRAIEESLIGYSPSVRAFWHNDGRLDRAEPS